MRTFRLLLVPLALFFALGVVPQAHADEPIAKSYLFEGRLDESGILTVTETIKFDAPPTELTQRIANRAPIDPDRFYVYGISDVSATGVENFASRTEGDYTVLSMKPSTEVKITYKVTGTTRSEPGTNGDASVFTWRALQGLWWPSRRFPASCRWVPRRTWWTAPRVRPELSTSASSTWLAHTTHRPRGSSPRHEVLGSR